MNEMNPPNANDFRRELHRQFAQSPPPYVDVTAGELYRDAGGVSGRNHTIPNCCKRHAPRGCATPGPNPLPAAERKRPQAEDPLLDPSADADSTVVASNSFERSSRTSSANIKRRSSVRLRRQGRAVDCAGARDRDSQVRSRWTGFTW